MAVGLYAHYNRHCLGSCTPTAVEWVAFFLPWGKWLINYEMYTFLVHLYGKASDAQGDHFFANNQMLKNVPCICNFR